MPLSEAEQRVCRLIEQRRGAMLDDLRLHVGLATGGFNAAALDETRERLCSRLRAIGAVCEMVPGEARPEWLYKGEDGVGGGSREYAVPPTAVCRIGDWSAGASGPSPIMVSGHLDTVHDPKGAFRELTVSADGGRATGPGCVDMKGGLVIEARYPAGTVPP